MEERRIVTRYDPMLQLAHTPAALQIESVIDSVGRKFRAQRMLRGAMFFTGYGLVSTVLAAFLAHFAGQARWTELVLGLWAIGIVAGISHWIVRPLFSRPSELEVARFVESRVAGLHNGLTNSLLLARRQDIADSPWLPQIYAEIARDATQRPLGDAVQLKELRPAAQRLLYVVIPVIMLAAMMPEKFAHGFAQLFHPVTFIPSVGRAESLDIQPKDVTLIAGQPLEITVRARAKNMPPATLIFDLQPGAAPRQSLPVPRNIELPAAAVAGSKGGDSRGGASQGGAAELEYSYRVDRLDQPVRYRVEVAGTQSPWYSVMLVPEVKLVSLNLKISPPSYTGLPVQSLSLSADEVAKKTVNAAEGSQIKLETQLDVPVSGAMLQCGEAAPVPMSDIGSHQLFTGELTLSQDTPVAVLITDGAKQIIARIPANAMVIHCIKDTPPAISMRWPTQDISVAPDAPLRILANLRDDYGTTAGRVLMSSGNASLAPANNPGRSSSSMPATQQAATAGGDRPPDVVHEEIFGPGAGVGQPVALEFELKVSHAQRVQGNSIRVQVEAVDNRNLGPGKIEEVGPQTARSSIFEIKFEDPAAIAREEKERSDQLHDRLAALLKQQLTLYQQTDGLELTQPAQFEAAAAALTSIAAGQADLRADLQSTAETFPFQPDDRMVQKTLLMVAVDPAAEAVDMANSLRNEPVPQAREQLQTNLATRQRRIITTLQSLLELLSASPEPATQPAQRPHEDLLSQADQFKKLDDALKQFAEQQQKILDQTAGLAKKPVDHWDDNDRKALDDLKMAQEKLDAFMQQKVSDFSKNADQDMSNSSLLKDLSQIFSETTMAKDALNQQAVEIAVADEDNGLELAKELSSNIEKWLSNSPDRAKWTQEDPAGKTDTPMPELPKDLQDMVGKLLEQEEDLFDQVEDANANWADSADKGIGMDALDGPIADMSAKGVTGNALPNDNEMNGRSGEGRQGKSQGEFVGDSAEGKGGRRTPTRLDPTPFAKGQVKDGSKDPSGGATGGGKLSGEGGEGLEGPVPPKVKATMQRLADKQAELRNTAERLNLQYHLDRYDNFKLAESVALMRRVESDLNSNRYSNALRHRDITLDDLDTSRLLLGGEVHVQQDTTPKTSQKLRSDINDAMKGELPPAWSEALKAYYQKLGEE
jgi:hypothetical protein